jgi:hypothetical protein
MQHRVHEVPRTIPRERPPRPIRPMRPRSQAKHQDSRVRIAKSRHRPRPILLVPIRLSPRLPNARAVLPQPRAALTAHNRLPQLFKHP